MGSAIKSGGGWAERRRRRIDLVAGLHAVEREPVQIRLQRERDLVRLAPVARQLCVWHRGIAPLSCHAVPGSRRPCPRTRSKAESVCSSSRTPPSPRAAAGKSSPRYRPASCATSARAPAAPRSPRSPPSAMPCPHAASPSPSARPSRPARVARERAASPTQAGTRRG